MCYDHDYTCIIYYACVFVLGRSMGLITKRVFSETISVEKHSPLSQINKKCVILHCVKSTYWKGHDFLLKVEAMKQINNCLGFNMLVLKIISF